MKQYIRLAQEICAYHHCRQTGHSQGMLLHEDNIDKLMHDAPHGSGFNNGTGINLDISHSERLELKTSYHHMNDNGMYVKWTCHNIIIKANLTNDFSIKVTGENYNNIKEYITDIFVDWLEQETELPAIQEQPASST